jgi:hypothetical protein
VNNKIRLVANPDAAAAAGLRISPEVLAIAQIRKTEPVK